MKSEVNYYMLLFAYSIAAGAFIGVIYDAFRIVRIVLPKAKAVIFAEDILFCLTATAVMVLFIFNSASGIVREFIIIGSITGFTVYYLTIGRIVYRLSELIIAFIKRMLKFIYKAVATPIKYSAKKFVFYTKLIAGYIRFRQSISRPLRDAAKGFGLRSVF